MEVPQWLRTGPASHQPSAPEPRGRRGKRPFGNARFLDKTLRQAVSFAEDTLFNESISARKGLLQMIEPGLKVISLLAFVVAVSLQKSVEGIAVFLLLALLLVFASLIPLGIFVKRLLPAALLTLVISLPVVLNLVVEGDPLVVLFRTGRSLQIGPLAVPPEITVTRQGVASAVTLLLRVVTSVSLVFLLTMTTPPNTFVKTLSSFFPGTLRPLIAIGYRYIFFLVRKVEHFVMGLRSRQIATVTPSTGRHWVASRIGLLFSLSMELSDELAMAMESRGFRGDGFKVRGSAFTVAGLSGKDIIWLVFSTLFAGVMIWKSFA